MGITGLISSIQRMSVHDGPGIRTTVFLKGCNMRCAWCHNPEAIHTYPEYVFNPKLCLHCGHCAEGCYSGARILCGKETAVEEVMAEVSADQPYYGETGGLTVSGGEPFMQTPFLLELLKSAKARGIHCGVETNGSMPFERMEQALPFVDVWMIDLKAFDDEIHKDFTGISNGTIMKNLRELDRHGAKIILRTPVVPGVNDAADELEKIVKFAAGLKNLAYYEVLPYHPLGLSKQVEDTDFIKKFETPDKPALKAMLGPIVEKYQIPFRFANIKMS
ncbi:MAG TPA: glycyl-radical enzyme activating protein [Oscillospiraceae bacterium]|nr:glycyl-radical enzyme activating protein [Oscillospiraceae bacterium]HPF55428.1 glycyl-radical enzyme activating protein [Clostridiales bacterium]HPK34464.1 glycyl-radical enzyme activating protein [Oscillospiraceae bacterium]HPR76290.1 glycyl-radical enzyme activating protein [Oscillospiraceae bacterium]